MADLSPAAQAVADATEILVHKGFSGRDVAAAALRAAADQVVPVSDHPDPSNEFQYGKWIAKRIASAHLLAIADELEGADG